MHAYLNASDYIDCQHPEVVELAARLAEGLSSPLGIAESCFVWVRDTILHTGDYRDSMGDIITCRASDVLREGTGYCFAKSHLLVALLRANSIPAGLCYQRLSRDDNGPPFCLHGLAAVKLPDYGWYRIDPRGNKPGVQAEFTPPVEQLAFSLSVAEEADLVEIWPEPLPIIVETLTRYDNHADVWSNLPDIELIAQDIPHEL
ncbi:MAG: Cro/Cl family transcriptional regulator [Desulfuromonas sp.]|nr:MAG: Cro/Cl family transcriptional regulator [Desulfuromonas sp.]